MNPGRCSLLIVEDDLLILDLLVRLLRAEFEIHVSTSAEQARQLVEQHQLDIVLTDYLLPGENGVQFLQWFRERCPRTVRILISGVASLEDLANAINCSQIHRVLFKPWQPEQLLNTLRSTAHIVLLERSHDQLLQELRNLNSELERRVALRTEELEEANRQLRQKNLMLERMALTDSLTGLPNRRAMDRLARGELARRSREPRPFTIGLIDADNFKQINSQYLLPGGDHALCWLAQTLERSVRASDTIGRVGGEEFMIVAPETPPEGAIVLAERIRRTVANGQIQYLESSFSLTVSIGVVTLEPYGEVTYEEMRLSAAEALAQAKERGRNCVVARTLGQSTAK